MFGNRLHIISAIEVDGAPVNCSPYGGKGGSGGGSFLRIVRSEMSLMLLCLWQVVCDLRRQGCVFIAEGFIYSWGLSWVSCVGPGLKQGSLGDFFPSKLAPHRAELYRGGTKTEAAAAAGKAPMPARPMATGRQPPGRTARCCFCRCDVGACVGLRR